MEAMEPQTVWIIPMGYEVEEQISEIYTHHMMNKLMGPKQERFGTYAEKSLKLHQQFKKPMI